jgi:hypothetical protein
MMIGGGMIWGSLLVVLLLLGFAYIVWVLASKESGSVRLTGQGIALVIAVLALVILVYGSIYGGIMNRGRYGWSGRDRMMSPEMMRETWQGQKEKMHEYMDKMMKTPETRKWIEEYMQKEKK